MLMLFILSVPILTSSFPSLLWHCWLGDRKGIRPVKSWVLVCWWWRFDWCFARLTAPVVTTTASVILSSIMETFSGIGHLENGRATKNIKTRYSWQTSRDRQCMNCTYYREYGSCCRPCVKSWRRSTDRSVSVPNSRNTGVCRSTLLVASSSFMIFQSRPQISQGNVFPVWSLMYPQVVWQRS